MPKINEYHLNPADTKEIFKTASTLKNTRFGSNKKRPTVADLHAAWKDHTPNKYPDDTEDISNILQGFGYSDNEIESVYNHVLGEINLNQPPISPTIQKIADYIIANDMKSEMIEFLEGNYAFKENKTFKDKLVVEEIREIFTHIVEEEGLNRPQMIKELDFERLGRYKK